MNDLELITRAEAKAQERTRYYTGKPCTHGHAAERYVCSSHCVECRRKQTREYGSTWRKENPDYNRKWCEDNVEQKTAIIARRRATKLAQTPSWCLPGTDGARRINEIYATAAALSDATGIDFVVDHIVPLSEGGLHEPSNLTPLPAPLNASKGSRTDWTPDDPIFESVRTIDVDTDDSTGHIADHEGEYDDRGYDNE